ncbi:MAG TPA: ATP-binding protein, partial [Ruminiclostridium sp.]|nr:ATP-binding protein [Ruminiclostridium sp.]
DIAELSREIIIEYLPMLEKEGIALSTDIPETVVEIRADRDMLSRAIRNLLDNAIKYGATGKWLGYELSADYDSVYIRIKDNGQGIDSENQRDIFSRFYRGDKGRTPDGGMGLGLAIADEIVKLHAGSLRVESEKGRGATFIITLRKA